MKTYLAALALALATFTASAQSRINQAITPATARTAIPNSVSPRAALATDLGELPAATPLTGVTLRFSLTPAQNKALDQLLADQQNPASPRYHQWLTPESYAAQFGLSPTDLAAVTAYLTSEGLTVTPARSRAFVTLSGSVAQVSHAFATTLHSVSLNGEQHYANLTAPQLPTPLAAVTAGFTGLNDFRLKPRSHIRQVLAPQYTSSVSGSHYLAPGDLYTIYDINPLLTSSVTGSGVTIAVLGQTDISLAAAAAFRAASGLTANPPAVKLYGTDPGISTGDLPEAMVDVEWSGAIAPAATILYVNSTDVIAGSLTQAIDNNLAPILSLSYGDCEQDLGSTSLALYQQLFRQANAQGQTVVGPGGDDGATDCDYQSAVASSGLAVDFPASSPNVTGVGGTMFNEGTGTYFNTTNNANSGSAISYIPEAVWNETAASGSLAGGGGGASAFFTKPSYQTGNGVPADFARDVPDIALDAAYLHDGYLFCSIGDCSNGYRNTTGYLDTVGGTSVGAPEFAGMLALLEQKIQTRIGNANPTLYGLANSTYASAVFHDITTGTNAQPCVAGTLNCPSGGTIGYTAATGYDLASGWGSVDAFNMVSDWLLVIPTGVAQAATPSVLALTDTAASVIAGTSITFNATVGSGSKTVTSTPTGTVQFLLDNTALGSAVALTGTTATYTLATGALASGPHTVTAAYSGDGTYTGSKSTVLINITAATAADFTLTPLIASTTAASGHSAPGITFTVAAVNGFTGNVTFSASTTSSTLANTSSPSFSINPVILTSTTPGSTVLTLSAFLAQGRTALALAKPTTQAANITPWTLAGTGLTLAALLGCFLPRRRRVATLLAGALTVATLTLSGCYGNGTYFNGSNITNTPTGTYSVLVTATGINATGQTVSHNSTITFTVQ